MTGSIPSKPPAVRPEVLVHQEGVIAVVAAVGLGLRDGSPLSGLAAQGELPWSVAVGALVGLGASVALWLSRRLPPLDELQRFQRGLVRGWTATDAVAVALLSGLAEEALLRALLQPVIGLVPAAVLFAVLHLVPDRRLWMWPVIALGLGLVLGLLFQRFGYPAAAAAHVTINLLALLRLRSGVPEGDGAG